MLILSPFLCLASDATKTLWRNAEIGSYLVIGNPLLYLRITFNKFFVTL